MLKLMNQQKQQELAQILQESEKDFGCCYTNNL